MLNDEQKKSVEPVADGKDVNGALKELNGVKKFKSLDYDDSSGFVCDVNTGICGPVIQKEEDRK